ncbi:hypothetical protein [Vulcanococcus limneticus]|uniref:hypothetical protein n=1 Tax=Vulcanococcus limneticus TaxID=2170428 RepID=UPI00398BD919
MAITIRALTNRDKSAMGFSMIEVILAVVIATTVVATLATVFVRTLDLAQRASNQNAIEAAVSTDLAWIKRYAKFWRMKSGPYSLSKATTKTNNEFTTSPVLSYECANADLTTAGLSTQFLADADSVSNTADDIEPSLPYKFNESTEIPIQNSTQSYILTRAINTSDPTHVHLTYNLTGGDSASLAFKRQASIILESAAWCTGSS